MEKADQSGNIFINGKAQIIEMLPYLTPQEREKLIRNIRTRNSQLAEELMEQSIDFQTLLTLEDQEVEQVLSYIEAPVLGVALKALPMKDQRKILSICSRPYAEKVFHAMNAHISNEQKNIIRACERVKSVIVSLAKKKRINA